MQKLVERVSEEGREGEERGGSDLSEGMSEGGKAGGRAGVEIHKIDTDRWR